MKQVLIGLLIAGILPLSANAQNKGKSNYNKNYPVCIKGNQYAVCDNMDKATEQVGRDVKVTSDDRTLHLFDTYVHMGYRPMASASTKNNPRLRVSYEDPNGAYEGKETSINDGVKKNIQRNLNYLDASMTLPPNDGVK
jgi:hypothetical protein